MSAEEEKALTERLLKQREMIFQLDEHYQTTTQKLEEEAGELERIVERMRRAKEPTQLRDGSRLTPVSKGSSARGTPR